jgi:hypothetical protein
LSRQLRCCRRAAGSRSRHIRQPHHHPSTRRLRSAAWVEIANAKVFYKTRDQHELDPTYSEVLNCATPGTLGPNPCVSGRTEYSKKNTTNADLWGDWEFVILASHNGGYKS